MNENLTKITYTKSLGKTNFNSTLSIAIDSNVNIKTVLSTQAYMFDEKIECLNGKAILTAKIGLKVLYIDTDGISNTITENQTITETLINPAITTDSYICINNTNIIANILSNDGVLKVSCDVSLLPILYFNLPLTNNIEDFENVINKKSEINSSLITNFINTSFNYTTNFETKLKISKILCHDAYFTPTEISAKQNMIYVEGKICSRILFEANENDNITRTELFDIFNVSQNIEVEGLNPEQCLDLNFCLDKSGETLATEFEDDNSIITITNKIKVCGVAIKNVTIEIVDDAFSTQHNTELTFTKRDFTTLHCSEIIQDKIFGEIVLTDKEPAIEDIVANLCISPEITNFYIKNNALHFEGVITSQLCYEDENKQSLTKKLEFPFILNSKLEFENVDNVYANIHIENCKIKAKRGTIIEMEYSVEIRVRKYSKQTAQMVDNITLGAELNFNGYDYQIYIGKPNETIWELCKRIKINPTKLSEINKNLPLVLSGGEKIVIKR